MKIQVETLTATCRSRIIPIVLPHKAEILGRNSSGKSLLADALVWGLTGSPINGDVSQLVGVGDSASRVEMNITIDGAKALVIRELKKNLSGTSSVLRINHIQNPTNGISAMLGLTPKALSAMLCPQSFFFMSKGDKEAVMLSLSRKKVPYNGGALEMIDVPKEIKSLEKTAAAMELEISSQNLEAMINFDKSVEKFDTLFEKHSKNWNTLRSEISSFAANAFQGDPTADIDFYAFCRYCEQQMDAEARSAAIASAEDTVMEMSSKLKEVRQKIETLSTALKDALTEIAEVITSYGIEVSLEKETTKGKSSVVDMWYRDIPIETCSRSEQVFAALALAEAFQEISGHTTPIIIDNAECVVGNIEADTQLILFYALDMPLSVAIDDATAKSVTGTFLPRTPKSVARRVVIT